MSNVVFRISPTPTFRRTKYVNTTNHECELVINEKVEKWKKIVITLDYRRS